MGAKQSAEMKKALSLVAGGTAVRIAAKKSGVWYTSVYQSLAKSRKLEEAKAKERLQRKIAKRRK